MLCLFKPDIPCPRRLSRRQFKAMLMAVAVAGSLPWAASSQALGSRPPSAQTMELALPLAGLATAAAPVEAGGNAGRGGSLADSAEQSSAEQVAALEHQVAQLLAEAQRQRAQLTLVSDRLVSAEAAHAWLALLLLGLGGAAALAAWLAWQLGRLKRQLGRQAQFAAAEQADWHAGAKPEALPSASPPLFSQDDALSSGRQAAPVSSHMIAASPAMTFAPLVAPAQTPAVDSFAAVRPVAVEELLDLDQQVDFFIVLGQQQAAIDLLLGHLRSTGGSSGLPYFKLLQIYRQQGDEEAYERTRDRFNQRFNVQAPDWQDDLAAGRCLAQYPEVIARLQRAWPQPSRAVAELEALLLRRADLEPFDLPAFHDLLTLHALVRDLTALPAESAAGSAVPVPATPAMPAPSAGVLTVDLLLPLGDDSSDFSSQRPLLTESGALARAMLAEWVFSRSTNPLLNTGKPSWDDRSLSSSVNLDLDLSDFAPAPREFTRPAAFTDVDMRRDSRRSDLAALDDSDLPPPSGSRA